MADIVERIEDALGSDTFWDTDAPPLLNDAVAEINRLREAIRRLAEQDATLSVQLSVQGGSVTVTMDATLTEAEREAVEWCLSLPMLDRDAVRMMPLRKLLERLHT